MIKAEDVKALAPSEKVTLPRLGVTLLVTGLSALEQMELHDGVERGDTASMAKQFISRCTGGEIELEALDILPMEEFRPLWEAVQRVNGLDIEEEEGNSEGNLPDASRIV